MHRHVDLQHLSPGAAGVFTAAELRRDGWSYESILIAAQRGELTRLAHGVYVAADAPEDATRCLVAPLKYLDQRRQADHMPAMITGDAALAVRGVEPFSLPLVPLVLVDGRCRSRTHHHLFEPRRRTLGEDVLVHEHGLRLASVGRSFADAASQVRVSDQDLRIASDHIRNALRVPMPELRDAWQVTGHSGGARLDCLLRAGCFEQESEGERRAFAKIFLAHPPVPDCQVVLHGSLRVDFVFLSAGLIIEYYGREAHEGRVEADATRVWALERLGYRVIVLTSSMLRDPAGAAAHIHSIRRDREQRIAQGALPLGPLPIQPERLSPLRTLYPLG